MLSPSNPKPTIVARGDPVRHNRNRRSSLHLMPELNSQAAHHFWKNYPDQSIYKVIQHMENMESWCLDGHEKVEELMQKIGVLLDNMAGSNITDPGKVVNCIAYLKTSRYLMLLQTLDSINPGSAGKIISYVESNASTNASHQLFLKRNIIFERLRLLTRICQTSNQELLTQCLEDQS